MRSGIDRRQRMQTIFGKLNLKDQREILVVNAPASFEPELVALGHVAVLRDPQQVTKTSFAMVFATKQAEVDHFSAVLVDKLEADAILWFAYPKATSRKFRCEFNRDSGWSLLREKGFDTVRQVAIDEDWSALRFRRTEYIKR